MKLVTFPAGARGFDTDAIVTEAQADAAWTLGFRFVGRCTNHRARPDQDASAPELKMLAGKGFGLFLYQLYYSAATGDGEWNAESGTACAAKMLASARALVDAGAFHPNGTLTNDMEGNFPSKEGARAFALVWRIDVAAAGFRTRLYVAYAWPLSDEETRALGYDEVWRAGAVDVKAPTLVQHAQVNDPFPHDPDDLMAPAPFVVADDWTEPAEHHSPPPPPANTASWSFGWQPEEDVGARVVRCCDEVLANGPMGDQLRAPVYACFVACGVGEDLSWLHAIATSCAIFVRAVLHWSGRKVAGSARSLVGGGMFMGWLGDLAPWHPAWVKWTGVEKPEPGDVFFIEIPGTNNNHVGVFLRELSPGVWETAEGGGGQGDPRTHGTKCQKGQRTLGPKFDQYGRTLSGFWRARLMGLPASAPATAVSSDTAPDANDSQKPPLAPSSTPASNGTSSTAVDAVSSTAISSPGTSSSNAAAPKPDFGKLVTSALSTLLGGSALAQLPLATWLRVGLGALVVLGAIVGVYEVVKHGRAIVLAVRVFFARRSDAKLRAARQQLRATNDAVSAALSQNQGK